MAGQDRALVLELQGEHRLEKREVEMSREPVPEVESIDKSQWRSEEYDLPCHFVNFAPAEIFFGRTGYRVQVGA